MVATYTINDERKKRHHLRRALLRGRPAADGHVRQRHHHRTRRPQGQPGRQGLLGHGLHARRRASSPTSPTTTSSCSSTSTTSAPDALQNGQVDVVTTDNVILLGFVAGVRRRVQARRRAVHRGAVRHRDREGRRRVLRVHQRDADRRTRRPTSTAWDRRRPARSRAPRPRRCPRPRPAAEPEPLSPARRVRRRRAGSRRRGRTHLVEGVTENLDLFWSGFLSSLGICLWGMVGALMLGTIIAAFRVSPIPSLRGFGTAYVTVVRNCPLTVVLFFFAFGLPEIGDQPVLLLLRRRCARHLHLRVRVRGAPLRHQRGPGRPGRGGPRDRPDLHARPWAR